MHVTLVEILMAQLSSSRGWLLVGAGLLAPVACATVTVEPPSGSEQQVGGGASDVGGQANAGGNASSGGSGLASGGVVNGGASAKGGAGSGGKAAAGGAAPLGGAPAAGGMPVIVMPYNVNFEEALVSWARVDGEDIAPAPWPIVADPANAANHVLEVGTASDDTWQVGGNSIWTDQAVQAKVKMASVSGYAYLATRFANANSYYYVQVASGSKPKIRARITSSTGSTSTIDVCASTTSFVPVAGTWFTMLITAKGSTISASIDGTPVCTGTNTSITAGGIALGSDGGQVVMFDDLSVTQPP